MVFPSLTSMNAFSILPFVFSTTILYRVLTSSVSLLLSPSVSVPGFVSVTSVFPSLSVTFSEFAGIMTMPSLSVLPLKLFGAGASDNSVLVSSDFIIASVTVTVISLTGLLSAFLATVTVIRLSCTKKMFSGSITAIFSAAVTVPVSSLTSALYVICAFSTGPSLFFIVTINPLTSPNPLKSVTSVSEGGTVACPYSFVTLLSVLSATSVNITVISFTGFLSLSVIVAVILFSMSIKTSAGSTTLICPSPIAIKASSMGFVSSSIKTLYPSTTALPSESVISLLRGGTTAIPFSSVKPISPFSVISVTATFIPSTAAPSFDTSVYILLEKLIFLFSGKATIISSFNSS